MIRRYRIWRAKRRLAADRNRRINSYEVQDFAKRRAAMLKHTRLERTA